MSCNYVMSELLLPQGGLEDPDLHDGFDDLRPSLLLCIGSPSANTLFAVASFGKFLLAVSTC